MMTKTALIDGDSFLYRAGFAVEKTKYLVSWTDIDDGSSRCKEMDNAMLAKAGAAASDGVIWSRKELGNVQDAVAILDGMIRKALDGAKCSDCHIYLTPATGNFRDGVSTLRKYKGDRVTRPVYYPDLREYMVSTLRAVVARGEEADDQISWVAREYFRNQGRDYCVVGVDKDLMQIPGDHYNWVDNETTSISDDEARLWYWAQVLAGDPGDNIGGCWGLGLKKASNFLVQCNSLSDDEIWPKVVRKYKESQKLEDCPYKDRGAEEVALETARLIRLRQTMNEPLWTPKISKDKGIVKEESKSAGNAADSESTT